MNRQRLLVSVMLSVADARQPEGGRSYPEHGTCRSYNAGPGRMRQLRAETARRGLDPNVWFGNVERVTSERVGRETVQYVGNIYKYYVAYRLATEHRDARDQAKEAVK